MLREERQRAILEILSRDGRVLVVDLAKRFHTSVVTIRKDLEMLHMKGRIHRTHGGALSVRESALEDPRLREKENAISIIHFLESYLGKFSSSRFYQFSFAWFLYALPSR
jgi:DeoR/GlpR family transcriptional regulator of sugar metabolism